MSREIMMKKLLTIGQLSKLSGIHVKALRYYESIHILKPAYVDPNNSYRYYTHSAIPYVKVIKICADYDIPLKTFSTFINPKSEIMMNEILQIAQDIIEEKEKALQNDKAHIEEFKFQIGLAKQLDQTSHHHIETGDEDYLLQPFSGHMLSDSYHKQMYKLLASLSLSKVSFNQRVGCYFKKIDGRWRQYLACKVSHNLEDSHFETICLKGSHVHAEHVAEEKVSLRIEQLDKELDIKEILILETLESPYNFTKPHLELRYFLSSLSE